MSNEVKWLARIFLGVFMKSKLIILLSVLSCSLFQPADIFKAIEANNKKEIKSWLKNNPDVDLVNDQGQTVLMKAVREGNKTLVALLLNLKAPVNVIDVFGKTALDYAVELQYNKIILKLVKHGAKVTTREHLVNVEKVVKRRARICLALSCGLVLIAGLVITTAIIVGAVLQFICFAFLPVLLFSVLLPVLIFCPSLVSEVATASGGAVSYISICLGMGIAASLPFFIGAGYCAASSARWYRKCKEMQVL